MRILHWAESFLPRIGGGEVFIHQLAGALQLHGHRCAIITNQVDNLPTYEQIDQLDVYRFPFTAALAGRDLRLIIRLATEVQALTCAWQPDILHLHTVQPSAFFFLRLQKAIKRPYVYTTHDPLMGHPDQNSLWMQIISSTTNVVAVSQTMRDQVISAVPSAISKTRVILNALSMPADAPTSISFHPPSLFCAARLFQTKGLDVLLRSLPAVQMQFPEVTAVIAGDGPIRAALQDLSRELGISHAVRFTGWIAPQQIPAEINHVTLVMAPSLQEESFGLILLQAMQMARPVIASRVGGMTEVVQHEQTGWLVPPGDISALSTAIVRMLQDPVRAAQFGKQGRERAQTIFSWERCLTEYERLYQQMVA
ncbi:putative Glycosyltransferase family 4 protein [Gammaproteobacteria bacterium]